MSIEFSVAVDKNIKLTDLRQEAEAILHELLNLSPTPPLAIKDGRREQSLIGDAGESVTFEVQDQGEANLMFLDLPHEDTSREVTERIAVISGSGLRTEASVALALALAIALARMVGKPLIDDSLLFSAEAQVVPDILLAQLKLRSPQSDLSAAARELLSNRGVI